MRFLAIKIKLANDVPVQRLHDADARHHRRAAKRSDQDQGLHGRLPFLGFVLGLRKFGDLECGVAQCDQGLAARHRDRIEKPLIPRHRLYDRNSAK